MNRIYFTKLCLALLVFASCAISKKENERLEKMLSQQSAQLEMPMADSLGDGMLRKYEERAVQKLEDFYDYLGLIGHENYDQTMKEEIVVSAQDLFYNPRININPFDSLKGENIPVKTCLEDQQNNPLPDFSVSDIELIDSLELINTHKYEGQLSFVITLGKIEQRSQIQKLAYFSLRKINKTIGNDSVEVWEVFLEGIE